MHNAYQNNKKNITMPNFSFAAPTCPRCRNGDTRLSKGSKRSKDRFFNKLLRKAHRCNECYTRFWVWRPLRLLMLTGAILFTYNYLTQF